VETLVNQSLFRDTSVAARTERTARVELLGLPADYFDRHLERLRALTPEEARDAVRDVYDPDALVILVLGNEEGFDLPLDDFGPVERIEVE
jgi:predicted Zn-dependent peptidase